MLPVCNHNQVNMVNVTWLNLLFGAGTSSFVFYISVFFFFKHSFCNQEVELLR